MYVKKCQALKRCTQKKIGRCWRCNERKVRGERVCSQYIWAWCGDCGVLAVDMTSSLCQTFHGKLSFWTSIITRNLLRLVRWVESGKIKINCRLRRQWNWSSSLSPDASPLPLTFLSLERERNLFAKCISKQKINNKNSTVAGYHTEKALAHQRWPPLTHKHNRQACLRKNKTRKQYQQGMVQVQLRNKTSIHSIKSLF